MGINDLFPTSLGTRQLLQFQDPSGVVPSFTVNLNPTSIPRTPTNLKKFTITAASLAVILGGNEAPPRSIALNWPMLDVTQVEAIVPFVNVNPCVVVLNDDTAYLGSLVIDSCEQLSGYTRNVWALKASFLVIAPYNGLHTTLNQLTPPTLSASLATATGYLGNPSDTYIWPTVFTEYGESTVGSVLHIHNTTNNAAYNITWTPPSSIHYRKMRLYYYSSNTVGSATLWTEVYSGFPSDTPNQTTLFNNYIEYSKITVPSYGTSFTGSFCGGIWIPST